MKKFMIFFIAVFAGIVSGCATGAVSTKMVPLEYSIQKKQPYVVAVQTTGGKETNPAWVSQISSESFKEALVESINKSGAFSAIVQADHADYMLDVDIVDLDQPIWGGIDMTVTMTAKWKLTSMKDKAVVFQENITKPYKAAFGDALIAAERLRLANEGTARENIREGLKKISELPLTAESKVASATLPSTAVSVLEKKKEGTPTTTGVEQISVEQKTKPDEIPKVIQRSGYTLEYEPMVASLMKGDLNSALTHADTIYKRSQTAKGPKQNKNLALLERGKTALAAGKYDQCIADLQEAEKRFLTIEGTISLTEGFGSILTDDTAMEYEAEMHEKLMISPYLILAYIGKGDFDGARVERNRTITKINQYIQEKPEERAYLENPFARYLTALMYEMEDKTDDAKIEYRKLKWDQETARIDSKKGKTTDLVILLDVGLAPQKYQKKWGPQKIPTPQGSVSLGFAYAGYAPVPTEVKMSNIYLNEKSVGEAKLLYDLEKTIITQYDKNKPALKAKIAARMTTKILAQVGAKMAAKEVAKNIPFASLFADILVDAAAQTWLANEQADLRGWLSLPKQIKYLRVNGLEPGENTIKIDYGSGVETKKIKVEKDRINIVYFAYAK